MREYEENKNKNGKLAKLRKTYTRIEMKKKS